MPIVLAHLRSLFTEFTENTTVQDSDGISKHRLMPISPTFYNITLINNDNWIPASIELKMLLPCQEMYLIQN